MGCKTHLALPVYRPWLCRARPVQTRKCSGRFIKLQPALFWQVGFTPDLGKRGGQFCKIFLRSDLTHSQTQARLLSRVFFCLCKNCGLPCANPVQNLLIYLRLFVSSFSPPMGGAGFFFCRGWLSFLLRFSSPVATARPALPHKVFLSAFLLTKGYKSV